MLILHQITLILVLIESLDSIIDSSQSEGRKKETSRSITFFSQFGTPKDLKCGIQNFVRRKRLEKLLYEKNITYKENQIGGFVFASLERTMEQARIVDGSAMILAILQCSKEENDPSYFDYSKPMKFSSCPYSPTIQCSGKGRTHSLEGSCNNRADPSLGMAYSPYSRILPPFYKDGVIGIRTAKSRNPLPNARKISLWLSEVLSQKFPGQSRPFLNHFAFFFFQMVVHDEALLQMSQRNKAGDGFPCCTRNYQPQFTKLRHPDCLAIELSQLDPFYGPRGFQCINFIRTTKILKDCEPGPGNPVNIINSFIDGSFMYGNNDHSIWDLIDHVGRIAVDDEGRFQFGDGRSRQTPMLFSSQSIMARLHNKLAELLTAENPNCPREWIFYEARRIFIGIYQKLVYMEFLPTIFGENGYSASSQIISAKLDNGFYRNSRTFDGLSSLDDCYDPKIDPSTTVEYSQAVSRVIHQFATSTQSLIDENGRETQFKLSDVIGNINRVPGTVESFLRGMMTRSLSLSRFSDSLQNELFKNNQGTGLDLFAIDLQREIENGVRPYVDYLRYFGIKDVHSFEDLEGLLTTNAILRLQEIFECVEDVPLSVGSRLEKRAGLGDPTSTIFHIVIDEQFRRHKCGDRLFFTRPGVFSPNQLKEILNVNMRRILCTLLELDKTPQNPFITAEEWIQCPSERFEDIFDISLWNYAGKCPNIAPDIRNTI